MFARPVKAGAACVPGPAAAAATRRAASSSPTSPASSRAATTSVWPAAARQARSSELRLRPFFRMPPRVCIEWARIAPLAASRVKWPNFMGQMSAMEAVGTSPPSPGHRVRATARKVAPQTARAGEQAPGAGPRSWPKELPEPGQQDGPGLEDGSGVSVCDRQQHRRPRMGTSSRSTVAVQSHALAIGYSCADQLTIEALALEPSIARLREARMSDAGLEGIGIFPDRLVLDLIVEPSARQLHKEVYVFGNSRIERDAGQPTKVMT